MNFLFLLSHIFIVCVRGWADQRTWISCDGPLPAFNYGSDDSSLTIQQLCASPENGGLLSLTAGGYCTHMPIPIQQHDYVGISFHQTAYEFRVPSFHKNLRDGEVPPLPPDRPSMRNKGRLALYCQMRCTCNGNVYIQHQDTLNYGNDLWDATGTVSFEDDILPDVERETGFPGEFFKFHPVAVDLTDATKISLLELDSTSVERRQPYLTISHSPYQQPVGIPESSTRSPSNLLSSLEPPNQLGFHDYLILLEDHRIECPIKHDLPTFPLPESMNIGNYRNNQMLCAVALSGGLKSGNAGAFCRPQPTADEPNAADIDFADEMTPRKEWTWDYGGYRNRRPAPAIRLRNHCWNYCRCAKASFKQPAQRVMSHIWPILQMDARRIPPGGSLRKTSSECYDSVGCSLAALHDQRPRGCKRKFSPGSICVTSLQRQSAKSLVVLSTCNQLPSTTLRKQCQDGDDTAAEECPSRCTGPQSCDNKPGCSFTGQCRVDWADTAYRLGSTAVAFTMAACVRSQKNARLPGRGVSEMPCVCNSTYVSFGCCRATDGLIWEKTNQFLGHLA